MNKDDLSIIKKLCKDVLSIEDIEGIEVERLGGLTNKNYKVKVESFKYVFRLPGEGTEELINRKDEHICSSVANKIGIDAKLLYFEDKSGIKLANYIENAQTMNRKLIKETNNMKAVAEVLKKLHSCEQSVPVIFDVFEKIEEYENLIRKSSYNYFWKDYEEVKKEVLKLQDKIDKMDIKVSLCHNDPLCENFVKGKNGMHLLDWEYAGMNDPMWDIADVFIEAEFTPEEEALFNNYYFGQEPDEESKIRILINKVFLDFLWSLWGLQRYTCGADLLEYANERYARTKSHLSLLSELNI